MVYRRPRLVNLSEKDKFSGLEAGKCLYRWLGPIEVAAGMTHFIMREVDGPGCGDDKLILMGTILGPLQILVLIWMVRMIFYGALTDWNHQNGPTGTDVGIGNTLAATFGTMAVVVYMFYVMFGPLWVFPAQDGDCLLESENIPLLIAVIAHDIFLLGYIISACIEKCDCDQKLYDCRQKREIKAIEKQLMVEPTVPLPYAGALNIHAEYDVETGGKSFRGPLPHDPSVRHTRPAPKDEPTDSSVDSDPGEEIPV